MLLARIPIGCSQLWLAGHRLLGYWLTYQSDVVSFALVISLQPLAQAYKSCIPFYG
jgi:hypothetical protein